MANTIGITIDLKGVDKEVKELEKLTAAVDRLTKERKDLLQQEKKGIVTSEQASKKRAALNLQLKATRNRLRDVEQGLLKQNNALRKTGGLTQTLGKSFKSLGRTISGAFIGLFAIQEVFSFIREGIDVNREFEKSLSELKAITGATESDLEKFSDAARRLGKVTTKSAVEVAQAFTLVGSKRPELLKNADALIEVTESAILLSEAAGIQIPEAADVVTLALNQFGDSAGGAAKVTDVLAAAAKEGSVLIPQLGEELSKVGGIANNSGLSIQQTAASIEVVGKTVEQSGTKLRNILIELESGASQFRPSVVGLDKALDNLAKAGFEDTAALADKFGKQNAEAALQLIKNRGEVTRLTDALDVNGEALRQAQAQTDNLDGAQKRLGSAFDELFITIGEGSEGGALTKLIDNIAEGINSFSAWAEETGFFSEIFKILTSSFKAMVLPVKLVFKALSNLFSGLDEGESKVSFITKALRVWNGVITTIIDSVTTLFSVFKGGIGTIADVIGAIADGDFSSIGDILAKGFKDAGKEAAEFGNRTVKTFSDAVDESVILAERETAEIKKQEQEKLKAKQEALDEITAAKKKALEDEQKEIENATKKAQQQAEKLEQQNAINAIEKTRNGLLARLELQRRFAVKEIGLSKATEEAKEKLIAETNKKFELLKEDQINKFAKEDEDAAKKAAEKKAAEDKKEAERLDAEAQKEAKVKRDNELFLKQQAIDVAQQTALALTDVAQRRVEREKDIELANLDAKVQQGLITQQEFEAKKLEIEREAFNKKKALELANIAIALATEIANINAAAAANPLNAATGGVAGLTQAGVLTALAVTKSAIQAGIVASQKFADGGYTGGGIAGRDETGFRVAGVVHEDEYVVPKRVLETGTGSRLVGQLENMRIGRPSNNIPNIGFANGGFTSNTTRIGDMSGLEDRIAMSIKNSILAIPVVNNATDTQAVARSVQNTRSEASFG